MLRDQLCCVFSSLFFFGLAMVKFNRQAVNVKIYSSFWRMVAVNDFLHQAVELKSCRKATPHHLLLSDLPKEDQFRKLGTKSKYFIDTIKLIAYRAETALVNIARQTMSHQNEARRMLRSLYATEADILPDYDKKTLTVRLHNPANRCSGVTVKNLCRELNETNTKYPGTDLRLVYELVS